MYEPASIVTIDLTLPQASVEALEAVPPTSVYQEATFSLAETDGTPGGIGTFGPPLTVGIRIKGKAGSFRPLPQKSAFKIKFNSFVSGQKFLGLKKMTLNNMVQDPSMVHEALSYEAFQAMDVRGSRTGYAFVRLNGEPLGVYLNIEDLDDVGLEKRFGAFDDPQHIYEGEYGVDVRAAEVEDFEVDEGDDEDLSDLEAFAAAVEGSDPADWSERIEPHADLDQMTRMWAVENYVGHWDGYAGAPDDSEHDLPNNYYLFSDAAGRFQMLPWGTDQTWELDSPFDTSFDDGGGLLFEDCLADLSCAEDYEAAATEVLETVATRDLDRAARCTAELLAPWQALEEEPVRPYDSGQIADAVEATREFIAARPGELADWLGVGAPEVSSGDEPCSEGEGEEGQPTGPTTPGSAPAASSDPAPKASILTSPVKALRLRSVAIDGRRLKARVSALGPGRVKLLARLPGRGPEGSTVCVGRKELGTEGAALVECRLSRVAWQALAERALRLHLQLYFRPATGPFDWVARSLTVPRR